VATLKPGSQRFAAWRAEGLAPDTDYEYTVAACGGESASGVFRTLPVSEPSRPVKIAALAGLMGPNVCKHATEV
jgi:phosphodiesterase/alkaline phosphatase D-like protein